MIDHQKKGKKHESGMKKTGFGFEKRIEVVDGSDMIIDPELDRFSGEEFLPEKHKREEKRLLKSSIPDRPSLK